MQHEKCMTAIIHKAFLGNACESGRVGAFRAEYLQREMNSDAIKMSKMERWTAGG